jgi:hypothetical protein
MQITADGCEGKSPGAGEKMKKGFFLDGVNMNGTGKSINNGSQYPVDIHSGPAFAALAGFYQTFFRT